MELSFNFIEEIQVLMDAMRKFAEAVEKIFGQLNKHLERKNIENNRSSKIPFRTQKKLYVKKSLNIQRKVSWYTYKYKF